MSGHQHATIGDTVYFWFGANDTSGSGGDGATAVFDVREAGVAASAAPIYNSSASLLSDAGYPAGCYEIAVPATTGNGFAAGDTFSVFATLLIDSQNPTGFVGSCTLTPLAKEVRQPYLADGTAQAGTGTTITLESGEVIATNYFNGALALITGGTGFGQAPRVITSSTITTDVCEISPSWTTNPSSDSTYLIIPAQQGLIDVDATGHVKIQGTLNDLDSLENVSTSEVNAQVDTALSDIGLDHLVSAAVIGTDITDNSIVAKLVSASGTADWDDYTNANESLQALRAHGDTLDGKLDTIDTEVGAIQTDLDNATDGLGALKADLASIITGTITNATGIDVATDVVALKAVADAIQTITNQFNFTVAGDVDSNVQAVANAAISEGGSDPASPIGQT